MPVFLLVVLIATIATFVAPETYAAKARLYLKVPATDANAPVFVATQVELLKSEAVLGNVVDALGLNSAWGRKFQVEGGLHTTESLRILQGMLQVRAVTNTSIITICVYSDQNSEAAKIANAIAEVYCTRLAETPGGVQAEVIDPARASPKPALPDKPLNIAFGIIIGGILAPLSGAAVVLFVTFYGRNKRDMATPA